MLSAALAGITARLLCHPLDTIKTVAFTGFAGAHLDHAGAAAAETTGRTSRMAFVSAARSIGRREGVKGFYRGVGVACVGSAPGVALYLTTYDFASRCWGVDGHRSSSALVTLASGFVAEAVSCLVWVPIDVSKERLQSQPPELVGRYRNSLHALQTIARNEGVRGLYKGYLSTLASFGPYSAIYFACYEFLTRRLRGLWPEEGDAGAKGPGSAFTVALFAGAGGNIIASVATNPLELVKTRLQVQRAVLDGHAAHHAKPLFRYSYSSFRNGLATVAREEGLRALWRGVGSRTAYAAPNAAFTMAFYEWFKDRLGGR